MDPSTFVSMLVALVLPFVISMIHNPASITKLKKSLPALRTVYTAIGQLISVIEGTEPAHSLKPNVAALKRHIKV